MFKDYTKYCNKVIAILKRKQPNILFNGETITSGFVMGFAPSIVAEGLIKSFKLTTV
jgi:hypothetical protein